MIPVDDILKLADLIKRSRELANAARHWTLHKDWIANADGAGRYAQESYKIGRQALELWEKIRSENDDRTT